MINRRQFLTGMMALGASQVAAAGMKFLPNLSIHNPCLVGLPEALQQHPLMQEIWDGIDPSMMWDSHVHLTGVGDSEAGIWVNPNMNSFLHPILKLQKHFYMNGGCVNEADIDQSYKNRLLQLANEMPPGFKTMLFAFDWYHDEMGQQDKNHSIFHVANDYAANLAKENPERFEWVASIHPYRADAVDALDQAYAQGARAVKWIPSGMGIDPASKKCDAFYVKVAQLKMPIISHAGHEAAVQGGNQSFGNPLKMRNALDQGVKVVLAHCASDGEDEDLDLVNKPKVKSLALFTRMMEQDEYQ